METNASSFPALERVLNALVAPSATECQAFLALFSLRPVTKQQLFQAAGDEATELCFVNGGLLRMYYTTPEGKELNKSFVLENQFAAAYSAWLSNTPARFTIQAMEDTTLLVASLDQVTEMFGRATCWERLGRLLVEQLYQRKEQREAEFLLDDAETRYRTFQQRYPGLEQRITQYHVASYLGITPVALSRIRNR